MSPSTGVQRPETRPPTTIVVVPAELPRERVLHRRVLVIDQAVDLEREIADSRQVEVDLAIVGAVIADAGGAADAELRRSAPG